MAVGLAVAGTTFEGDGVDAVPSVAPTVGAGGLAIVLRLSAFIMLCIGVQIMWNGADALFGFSKMHP